MYFSMSIFLLYIYHDHDDHDDKTETEKFGENDPWSASGKLCRGGDTTSHINLIINPIIVLISSMALPKKGGGWGSDP